MIFFNLKLKTYSLFYFFGLIFESCFFFRLKHPFNARKRDLLADKTQGPLFLEFNSKINFGDQLI